MSERDDSFSVEIPIGPLTPEQLQELEEGNLWVLIDGITLDVDEDASCDALSGDFGASPTADTPAPATPPPARS